MNESRIYFKKHRAGAQDAAQSYHSYYLLLLALRLRIGEKIGYEVKDDLHIVKADGTNIFIQIKHTIQKNKLGNPINLTSLDKDLWDTLNNWLDLIQLPDFDTLENSEFKLITNKSDGSSDFINILIDFKNSTTKNGTLFLQKINSISSSKLSILDCKKKFKKLSKKNLELFLDRLSIETGHDNIIEKIKNEIYEKCYDRDKVQSIFNNFCSAIQEKKYLEICKDGFYELSFDIFTKEFKHCMETMYTSSPLPERSYHLTLPNDLESQIFIKQLLDVQDVEKDSDDIRNYTFQKMHTENILVDWVEENLVTQKDLDQFEDDSITKWRNNFKSEYRTIELKYQKGVSIEDLEDEIKPVALRILDELRKLQLKVPGNLYSISVKASNGYFYLLSDELKIGWHYDWSNRYKKL